MSRAGDHYMPRPDADFSAWANQYYDAVEKWWTANGFDKNELRPLGTALTAWLEAYPAHIAAQAAAEAARQTKAAARAELERQVRPITNFVQANPRTSNADRATMGITVRTSGGRRTAPPETRPVVLVTHTARLTHELRLSDEATPTRRARPRGIERAELFVAFTPTGTPAPAPPGAEFRLPPPEVAATGAFRYVESISDGSTTLNFDTPQSGLQAHYLARWVTKRGAIGPWSDTASATVAA